MGETPSPTDLLAGTGALSAALEALAYAPSVNATGRKLVVDELARNLGQLPAGESSKAASSARCSQLRACVLARLGR